MRTFIAVEISEEIKEQIYSFITKTGKELENNKIKWVEKENLHITLKFLGEIKPDICMKVRQILSEIVKNFNKFYINLNSLGVFPQLSNARVIWIDIHEKEKLKEIYETIENKLKELKLPKENREFQPHLTIGRIKFLQDKEKINLFLTKYKNTNFDTTNIEHITFFESILKPQGPEYRVIEKFPLQ